LGVGWNQEEAGAYGISLGASMGERMDMFDQKARTGRITRS
jgi:hypothetical protein